MFFKAPIEVIGHANIQASVLVCKDVCEIGSSVSQGSGFSRVHSKSSISSLLVSGWNIYAENSLAISNSLCAFPCSARCRSLLTFRPLTFDLLSLYGSGDRFCDLHEE